MFKVLVVTLFSGENEYEQSCKSVNSQVGVDVHHKIIEHLPKQEAHQKLYQLFNEGRKNFDFFAKLDADMAFSKNTSLLNILEMFDKGVDVVSATVYDGITGTDMQSFNVFSNKCRFFYHSNDPLFTDKLKIDYPGVQCSYVDKQRNVLHAFNPSPFQAFMFGVHRALKVVQPGKKIPSLNSSYHQKLILNQAYEYYRRTKSEHSKHALWGATLVFQKIINDSDLYRKSDYLHIFEEVLTKGGDIDVRLTEHDILSLVSVVGWSRFLIAALRQVLLKLGLKGL
ncbi:hypothetical protein [Marinobacter algicola]|uniref:Uncharacterized protein n=1 Tax=Marinobacter algicola DG893 TaxID=443152 RepID=A6F1I0_9GAMM|nr:hypothetical protein [Marinobacter algicola]EDM47381.1 hypothetical protein MDG893_01200 [Marinobacter algicola DG893]